MSKKQKGQKMSLSEFLGPSGSSWAEEDHEIPIGSTGIELDTNASASYGYDDRSNMYGGRRSNSREPGGRGFDRGGAGRGFGAGRSAVGGAGFVESRPHRMPDSGSRYGQGSRYGGGSGASSYSRRDAPQKPLPTEPPFIAYFGNLDHGIVESDLEHLLANVQVVSIRLIKDASDGSFKGFGYVEFENVESLTSALNFTGEMFHGRPLRVDVAESKRQPSSGFGSSDKFERGSKFGSAPDRSSSQQRFGGGRAREEQEQDDPRFTQEWRREKPLSAAAPVQREPAFRRESGSGDRSDRSRERNGSRAPLDRPRDFENRRQGPPSQNRRETVEPNLDLGAWRRGEVSRGAPVGFDKPEPSSARPPAKSSPFGAAKPVDTAKKILQVEEKISKVSIKDDEIKGK